MPTDFPTPQTPKRKGKKNFLPEILIAGVIFGAGAWFWSQNLTPAIPIAPEMKVAQAQEQDEAPANWKVAPEKEKQAAQKIIVAQLEAFKADDYKAAEKYQASGLKQSFASTEQFEQMIKANYPQFAHYKDVKWGDARIDGPQLQIQMVIVGQDDAQIAALYSMIKEEVTDDKGKTTMEYRVSGVNGGSMQLAPMQTV